MKCRAGPERARLSLLMDRSRRLVSTLMYELSLKRIARIRGGVVFFYYYFHFFSFACTTGVGRGRIRKVLAGNWKKGGPVCGCGC